METATTPVPATMSLWDLCLQGGWSMIPLALLLLLCVYVFVERLVVLRAAGREDANFMNRIRGYIHEGEIESALNLCRATATPEARLIEKGISRIGRPVNDVLVAIENTGNLEVAGLSRGLPWLATTDRRRPNDWLSGNSNRHGAGFLRHSLSRKFCHNRLLRIRHLRRSGNHRGRTHSGHRCHVRL